MKSSDLLSLVKFTLKHVTVPYQVLTLEEDKKHK